MKEKKEEKDTGGGVSGGNVDDRSLLYEEDESGTKTLWVPFRGRISKVRLCSVSTYLFFRGIV